MEETSQSQSSTAALSTEKSEISVPIVSSTERVFAAIGYIGPLFVLPLVVQPKSDFCKFHARQSMALFILFFVFLIFLALIPWLGSIITFALFAAYVLAMYKAYMGDRWMLPILGAMAQKIDFDALLGKASSTIANMNVVKETSDKLTGALGSIKQNIENDTHKDIDTVSKEKNKDE